MRDPAGQAGWLQRATLLLAMLCASTPSSAQEVFKRNPQVAVQGTGLRDLLASLPASADASNDQVDAELLKKLHQSGGFGGGPAPRLALEIELVRTSPGTSLGVYDGHRPVPDLMEVFPPEARQGWFALVQYRTDPVRVRVIWFDERATILGDRTYPGGDTLGVGFYLAGPGGIFHSQDARNPDSRPQALFFDGVPWHSWIITWEDQPADLSSDRDYDDVVIALTYFSEGPYTTDVRRTSWGRLKARFR